MVNGDGSMMTLRERVDRRRALPDRRRERGQGGRGPVKPLHEPWPRRLMLHLPLITALLLGGAGSARAALSQAQQSAIRIAYANGYKEGLEYAASISGEKLRRLVKDLDEMRVHVMLQADRYLKKVVEMNP